MRPASSWVLSAPRANRVGGRRMDTPSWMVLALMADPASHMCARTPMPSLDPHTDEQYTLRRLVRGLASSRDAARQGFAMALSELLGRRKAISLQSILDLADECIELSSKVAHDAPGVLSAVGGLLLKQPCPMSASCRVSKNAVPTLVVCFAC